MATATVSVPTNSPQEKPTRKPAARITLQEEKSGKHGVKSLIEIIERGSFYEQDRPLDPSDVSELYAAAKSYARFALLIGDCSPRLGAEYFDTRLADLKACVEASKSGKFNLPPREIKRCAGVFAMKLLRETCEWSECLAEEGREMLKEALKKAVS